MTFHEIRFPDDVAYGSSGGPLYSTDVIITAGGFEQRNINWQDARCIYNVAHGVKTQNQLDVLLAFFRARKGRAYAFRFKDWSDYSASMQQIGVGDGITKNFQLIKTYVSGAISEIRTIRKPVDNSVHIYVNNTLSAGGITVDNTTGIVSFLTPPISGAIIKATFEFDVPVRFDTDHLSASLDSYGLHSWKNIAIVEVRVGG